MESPWGMCAKKLIKYMKYLIIIIAFLYSFDGIGQDKRITFKIEAGYLSGIGQIKYGDALAFDNSSSAVRLRVGSSYFLTKRSSLGVTFGLDGYGDPVNNTAPLLLEAKHYFLLGNKTLFMGVGLGGSLKLTQEFEKGFHFSPSVGYVIITKKGNWIPSIGYNLQQISDPEITIFDLSRNSRTLFNDPFYLNSISFNLAFEF